MCAALWTLMLREGLPGGSLADGTVNNVPTPTRPVREVAVADEVLAALPRRALAYGACPSPFGVVHLAASTTGICAVSLYESEVSFHARLEPARGDLPGAKALLVRAVTELAEYFAGQRQAFGVPLDLRGTTPFDRRVLDAIAAIPYGATRTYGELTQIVGSPGAARAVGRACGRNPVPLLIACHRVVRAGGGLGGFGAGGPDVKARLLALERGAVWL